MTPTPPIAAVPAQPDALQDFEVRKLAAIPAVYDEGRLVERRPIAYRRELEDQFVRGFRAAESLRTQAAERAVPAGYALVPLAITDDMLAAFATAASADVDWHGATEAERQDVRDGFGPAWTAMLAASPALPAHVQTPAETEHVAADVSKNGLESNMTGGALPPGWDADDASMPRSRADLGRVVDEWNETTGALPLDSGWFCEVVGMCEDAYDLGRASHAQAPAGAALDPWREHLAGQADVIDCEALLRAMVRHGISFPEGGMEHFRASLGEMVNRFVRFAAPTAQAAPAAGAVAGPTDAQIIAAYRAYNGWPTAAPTRGDEAARWKQALIAAFAAAPTPAAQADSSNQYKGDADVSPKGEK